MLSISAHAQVDPTLVDRQNQIIERQQQDRLREEQDRAMRALPSPGGTNLQEIKPQVSVPDLGGMCRDIREVRFVGDTLHLPDDLQRSIQSANVGRCLGVSDLEGILATLTKSYIDRGYITTRVYLPAQDLRSGVLEVKVIEGKIERIDASQSDYTNVLRLPSGTGLKSEGSTISKSFTADRVVYRDQASRVSLSARLGTQSSRNWLGGEFLQVSSRDLSTLDLAGTAFTQVGGGILNARLGYVKGLTAFGALRDADNLPRDLPHAQFRKLTVDLGFSRRFSVSDRAYLWSSQFSGQHAYDTLYGSQQMLIGGSSSVRGFLNSVLSGDSGSYLRNELSMPWHITLANGSPLSGRVYTGFDVGHVSNRASGVPSGTLSGATLGASVQWKTLSLDAFAARAIDLPHTLKREGTLYGFRLSASL